jgi:glycolate oxidase FAD binding subunit
MNDTLLQDLTDRIGSDAVRIGDAAAAYSPATRPPAVALFPDAVEAVGEALALLDGAGASVLPWGGGTEILPMDRPPDVTLGTERLNRLIDYQPDDMTVTAEAGMRLADLQAILAERGQVVPIDPPHPERATLGGIVATNRTGPWRCGYRSPRDWLIGLAAVGADGRRVKGGGRVVKNVAGYDLPRLYAGSRGTLGVIVEVSFKVMPRPPAAAFVAVPLESVARAEEAIARIMDSDLIPTSLELLNRRGYGELTEAALGGDRPFVLFAGFEGVATDVTWQVHALRDLLAGAAATTSIPEIRREALAADLRAFPSRPGFLTASAALVSSDVAPFAARCEAEAEGQQMSVAVAAHAANGIVRLSVHSPTRDPIRAAALVETLRADAAARGGSLVVTGAAPELAGRVEYWGPPGPTLRLMRGLKETLDPNGTFFGGAFLGGL